jgi:hypothetical protein
VINSVDGGAAVAIALGALLDASLGLAAAIGGAAAIGSVLFWLRYADRLLEMRARQTEVLSPSPAAD